MLQCAAYALGAVRLPISSGKPFQCSIMSNATSQAICPYGKPIANGRHTIRFRRMLSEDGSVAPQDPYVNAIRNASEMSDGSAGTHQQRLAQHRRAHTHTPRQTGTHTHRKTHTYTSTHTCARTSACILPGGRLLYDLTDVPNEWPRAPMDRASAYEAGDCWFEIGLDHFTLSGIGTPSMSKTLKAHNTHLMETRRPHAGLNRGPYGCWPFALTS